VLRFIKQLFGKGQNREHRPQELNPVSAEPKGPGRWQKFVIYAARVRGEEGWRIERAPFELDDVLALGRENGFEILEARQITQGAEKIDGEEFDGNAPPFAVESYGWKFDFAAKCWRAPEETFSSPNLPAAPIHISESNTPMSASSWPDDQWVRVMCDYCAGGLWAKSGGAVWPIDLPVTNELRARVAKWQEWFEKFRPEISFRDEPEGDAFVAEGLAIAKAIKAELPSWTVIYFDESRIKGGGSAGQPREEYEYEVNLP
jgi:hypothetical protein